MSSPAHADATIHRLVEWGTQQPLVRAMILTSTRAIPNTVPDILSDYDVILILADVRPFFEGRAWLEAFGPLLALYRDPLGTRRGQTVAGYVTQYEDGLKIDFNLWTVELMRLIAADPQLPDELDAGYRVLLDKDGLTEGLQPPGYQAYIPARPAEVEYHEAVEVFFVEAAYVAKFLWRDDRMAAKFVLDNYMKQEHLRPMLEWHIECEHQWSLKPGPYGRGLKKWLRADLWAELEATYTGMGVEENWVALFATIALMRRVAQEVGERLGYLYPTDLERRVLAYLHKVKDLPPDASDLRTFEGG